MRKRIVAALTAGAVALSFAGCAPAYSNETSPTGGLTEERPSSNRRISEEAIKLSDGRTITCILYDGVDEASLQCDWGSALDSTSPDE